MTATPRPLRILLVDDYEDTVTTLCELLELYGHECHTALSGAEAIAALDGWEPDVAFLDICMPQMDGRELARIICTRAQGKPLLVAVTGGAGDAARREAQKAGFDHFLVKPVNPDVLTGLLRDYAATLENRQE